MGTGNFTDDLSAILSRRSRNGVTAKEVSGTAGCEHALALCLEAQVREGSVG